MGTVLTGIWNNTNQNNIVQAEVETRDILLPDFENQISQKRHNFPIGS
jgi:hypothetical protein